MQRSLKRLADLPGDYRVYPGHEGSTTLDYERRYNPFCSGCGARSSDIGYRDRPGGVTERGGPNDVGSGIQRQRLRRLLNLPALRQRACRRRRLHRGHLRRTASPPGGGAATSAGWRRRSGWPGSGRVPLGGSPADVLGMSLNLSAGDISEEVAPPQAPRRPAGAVWLRVPGGYGGRRRKTDGPGQPRAGARSSEKSTPGRISRDAVCGQAPDELCGLYWLMEHMEAARPCRGQVLAVRLPQPDYNENGDAVTYRGWGEVPPGEWHRFTAQAAPHPAPAAPGLQPAPGNICGGRTPRCGPA